MPRSLCERPWRGRNSYYIARERSEAYIAREQGERISRLDRPKGGTNISRRTSDELFWEYEMAEKSIKELAIELTVELTKLCDSIKAKSIYTNQLLRSCSSIGANAHEAKYAQSKADFISKLEISLKECYETEYWLEVLFKVRSLSEEQFKNASVKCGKIRRKLIASITTAKNN